MLSRTPSWTVDLLGETVDPVRTDRGLVLVPHQTLQSSKPSDIIVVFGGGGVDDAMLDQESIRYVNREASAAR